MKSEKAQKYIGDNECTYPRQGYVTTRTADEAVEMAEQEVEKCYENIVADLTREQIKNVRELSRNFDATLDERLKAEREKAKDAFCDLCSDRCPVGNACAKLDFFIEKLNEDNPRDRATSCLSDFQNHK